MKERFTNSQGRCKTISGEVRTFPQNSAMDLSRISFCVNIYCAKFCSHNTFATGGSDGYVNVWDGFNKKRLCQV